MGQHSTHSMAGPASPPSLGPIPPGPSLPAGLGHSSGAALGKAAFQQLLLGVHEESRTSPSDPPLAALLASSRVLGGLSQEGIETSGASGPFHALASSQLQFPGDSELALPAGEGGVSVASFLPASASSPAALHGSETATGSLHGAVTVGGLLEEGGGNFLADLQVLVSSARKIRFFLKMDVMVKSQRLQSLNKFFEWRKAHTQIDSEKHSNSIDSIQLIQAFFGNSVRVRVKSHRGQCNHMSHSQPHTDMPAGSRPKGIVVIFGHLHRCASSLYALLCCLARPLASQTDHKVCRILF